MAEKKESYSEEELNEMIVWFNNHADELPKEMQINKAAFTPDLKLTVESCIMQAKQNLGNYKMGGPFLILKQIRANIERHYKIFCVNGKYGIQNRVPYFLFYTFTK